jgi:hypothetical protein
MRAIIADSPGKKSSCCQPAKDLQRRFLRACREVARGAHAGWTSLLTGASGNEFAGFLHEETVRSKEGFGETDAAGIRVE